MAKIYDVHVCWRIIDVLFSKNKLWTFETYEKTIFPSYDVVMLIWWRLRVIFYLFARRGSPRLFETEAYWRIDKYKPPCWIRVETNERFVRCTIVLVETRMNRCVYRQPLSFKHFRYDCFRNIARTTRVLSQVLYNVCRRDGQPLQRRFGAFREISKRFIADRRRNGASKFGASKFGTEHRNSKHSVDASQ